MLRRALVVPAVVLALVPASPALADSCRFELGFATLAASLPAQVGACLDDENHDAVSGDAVQHTVGGLMAWRKADNWTAFTNGYLTWVHGPHGIVQRLNTQRFSWEANPDHLTVVTDGRDGTGQTVINQTSTSNSQGSTSSASNVTSYQITASQTSDSGATTVVMQSGGNGSDASSISGGNQDASGAGAVVTTSSQGSNGVSIVRSVQQQGTPGVSIHTGNVAVQGTSSPASSANGGVSSADGVPSDPVVESER